MLALKLERRLARHLYCFEIFCTLSIGRKEVLKRGNVFGPEKNQMVAVTYVISNVLLFFQFGYELGCTHRRRAEKHCWLALDDGHNGGHLDTVMREPAVAVREVE